MPQFSLFADTFGVTNAKPQPSNASTVTYSTAPSDTVVSIEPTDTICDIDMGTEYEDFLATVDMTVADVDGNPIFLSSYVSDPVEYDGTISSPTGYTMMADADPLEMSGTQEFNMRAFANAVDNAGYGVLLFDFEDDGAGDEDFASGNFAGTAADSTYTAATGTTFEGATGSMNDGTADGVLVVDGVMTIELFNTGDAINSDPSAWGDDPGIATNAGNDADRGYNQTPDGDHYLEVLPGEDTDGGVMICFDQGTDVYGFSFDLMGREETKRDVYIDIHFSDGSVHRVLTDTNALNAGGEQYYSFLIDPEENPDLTITAIVLYEPYDETTDTNDLRDIFSIDDLALVVDPAEVTDRTVLDGDDYLVEVGLDEAVSTTPTEGDDVLTGTEADEVIDALGGNDTIINAGGGEDTFIGGAGVDTLITDVTGLEEDSILMFNTVTGEHGREDSDVGQDVIDGIENFIGIGAWDMHLTGGDEDNILMSDTGNDVVNGGGGMDRLESGDGFDRLNGQAGNDILNGGMGFDLMTGGTGVDTFVFDTAESGLSGYVTDFVDGVDQIAITDESVAFRDLLIFGNNDRAFIIYDGQIMIVNGVEGEDLGYDDFVFGMV